MSVDETSYFFDVYGPFPVSCEGHICAETQNHFWDLAENGARGDEGLSKAIGCYMFCILHGKNVTPWYIGKTNARTGFKQEIFTQHKRDIYNECIEAHNGRPAIFLFPLCCNSHDRFSKAYSTGKKVTEWLERILMGFAFRQNPDISNTRDMHLLRATTVRGVFGQKSKGQPHKEVVAARQALLGIHPRKKRKPVLTG